MNRNAKKKQALGYAAGVSLGLLMGVSVLFVKLALEYSSPLDIQAYRVTLGFLCSIIPVVLGKVRLGIDRKALKMMLPAALCHPFLFFLLQALGLQTLPTAEAGIIQAMAPVFTLIIAAFLINKEKAGNLQIIFTLLSVAGVILVITLNGISIEAFDFTGTFYTILSTISISTYIVLGRRITASYSWYTLSVVLLGFGAVAFNVTAVSIHLYRGDIETFLTPLLSGRFLVIVFILAAGCTFLSNICANYSYSQLEASRASVFNNLSMVVTMIAGVLFLDERLYWYHVTGAVMILAGVFGANYFAARKKKAVQTAP